MTIRQAIVDVPATTRRQTVEITCDLCNISVDDCNGERPDWTPNMPHDVSETCVTYADGSNYGQDGGNTRRMTFHICPDCFVAKLIPWIRSSSGGKPTVIETDW